MHKVGKKKLELNQGWGSNDGNKNAVQEKEGMWWIKGGNGSCGWKDAGCKQKGAGNRPISRGEGLFGKKKRRGVAQEKGKDSFEGKRW